MTKVVVIGGGFGGLSAAIELANKGFEVDLLDPESELGGKVARIEDNYGNSFDCGPTVITLKDVFSNLFTKSDENIDEYVKFNKLDVIARHAWSSDETLDLFSDPQKSFEAVAKFAGIAEAKNFREFSTLAHELFTVLEKTYMKCQKPRMLKMINAIGLRGSKCLLQAGAFNSLWEKLERTFQDERLRQLFGRYATYCGSSPWEAPSTLMLIWDVEMQGVWSVEGGVINLARALKKLAIKKGVNIYKNLCEEILSYNGGITGVRLDNGDHILTDKIIFNGDFNDLDNYLINKRIRNKRVANYSRKNRSLSAITWMMKNKTAGFELCRHNIFFNSPYREEFSDIFKKGKIPSNPTVYVCAQDRLNNGSLVSGKEERLFLLINAPPNGDFAKISKTEMKTCQASVFSLLKKCGLEIDAPQKVPVSMTPQTFYQRFPGSGGALYGRPTHGWLSPFTRPSSRSKISGLYLSGGTVHPGPGLPMATISGQLAAEALMEDLGLINQ